MLVPNNRESGEYRGGENGDINNNYWINRLLAWWSGFSLRTKLLAIATLGCKPPNDRNNFFCTK